MGRVVLGDEANDQTADCTADHTDEGIHRPGLNGGSVHSFDVEPGRKKETQTIDRMGWGGLGTGTDDSRHVENLD